MTAITINKGIHKYERIEQKHTHTHLAKSGFVYVWCVVGDLDLFCVLAPPRLVIGATCVPLRRILMV